MPRVGRWCTLQKKMKNEIIYYCLHCEGATCLMPCFELYHTFKTFKGTQIDTDKATGSEL